MSHIKCGKVGFGLVLGLILCTIASPTYAEDDDKAKPKDAGISSSEHRLMAADTTIVDPISLADPNDLPCPGASVKNVAWSRFPKNDIMLAYFPHYAYSHGISGRAQVTCSWESGGRITDCQILWERPKKYGFGVSIAKFMIDMTTVESTDKSKKLEAGSGVCMTIVWDAR